MATTEIKDLFEKQAKAFEDFKSANDERLMQIEAKGAADPLLEEKVDKANADIDAIGDSIKAAETTIQNRVDELELKINGQGFGGDEIKNEAAKFWAAKHKISIADAVTAGVDIEAFQNYENALDKYMRLPSDALTGEIRNAMSVGSDPDGGFMVTPEIAKKWITRLFETSPMRQYANVVTIGTDEYQIPKDTNDATSGGWVGEVQSRDDTDTSEVGLQKIPVHEQYAKPKITQKLLDDAQFNVATWLGNKTTDKMIRTENTAFVSGDGVAQPRGFTDYASASVTTVDGSRTWGILQYIATGSSGAFAGSGTGADEIMDLIYAMKGFYRAGAVFACNRLTMATIRKIKDGQGNYLWNMGNVKEGQPASLLSYPLAEFEDMADISANSYSLAFGNFKEGYTIVDRAGFRMLKDPYTGMPYVKFYTSKRVGGDVTNFDAIKLLKFGSS